MAAEIGRTGIPIEELLAKGDPDAGKTAVVVNLKQYKEEHSSPPEGTQTAPAKKKDIKINAGVVYKIKPTALEELTANLAQIQKDRAKSPLLKPQTGLHDPFVDTYNAMVGDPAEAPLKLYDIGVNQMKLGMETAEAYDPRKLGQHYFDLWGNYVKFSSEASGHGQRVFDAATNPNHANEQMIRDRADTVARQKS